MGFFDRLFRSTPTPAHDYARAVRATAGMTRQPTAQALALAHGLTLVNVAWEDAARFQGSCVGPNISDLTIQVHHDGTSTCMPVLRHPNFVDRTCDVPLDRIQVPVGNEREGQARRHVPLRTYLSDLRRFLSVPGSWDGDHRSLLRDGGGDDDVLVSAQACFLPVPKQGEARFNPVLFNYQSRPSAPAVLAILVTREGTSATIIDNQRDAFATGPRWGQRLFHNAHGQRASLVGTRVSDFVAGGGDALDAATTVDEAAGLHRVLLIQVPLVQPERPAFLGDLEGLCAPQSMPCPAAGPVRRSASFGGGLFARSNVEEAVIGHGGLEGPFTEIDGQPIRRDERFPIRVTVQFYQATDNGVCSVGDVQRLAAAIDEVYADGHGSGSLVFGDAGRPTAWDDGGLGTQEPPGWWHRFWSEREAVTGRSRQQLQAELTTLLGQPVDPDLLEAVLGPAVRGET